MSLFVLVLIKNPVSVVQEKTTILCLRFGVFAYVDKHLRSIFCRQNAMQQVEKEKREVRDQIMSEAGDCKHSASVIFNR
jgi:hypothetical protein